VGWARILITPLLSAIHPRALLKSGMHAKYAVSGEETASNIAASPNSGDEPLAEPGATPPARAAESFPTSFEGTGGTSLDEIQDTASECQRINIPFTHTCTGTDMYCTT
jgi:hypothetical protein